MRARQLRRRRAVDDAALVAAETGGAASAGRVVALPWAEIARAPPSRAAVAASMAGNYFRYFALAWLPAYFNCEYGLDTGAASASTPFVAAAATRPPRACSPTRSPRAASRSTTCASARQLVGGLGPAAALAALAAGGDAIPYEGAQAIFAGGLAAHAFIATSYESGVQDISRRSASLIVGVVGGVGIMSGAASQYITGAILDANGRDFVPVFAIAAAVQVAGTAAFVGWWDSERRFE